MTSTGRRSDQYCSLLQAVLVAFSLLQCISIRCTAEGGALCGAWRRRNSGGRGRAIVVWAHSTIGATCEPIVECM